MRVTMPCVLWSQTIACASGMLTRPPCRSACSSPAAWAMSTSTALSVRLPTLILSLHPSFLPGVDDSACLQHCLLIYAICANFCSSTLSCKCSVRLGICLACTVRTFLRNKACMSCRLPQRTMHSMQTPLLHGMCVQLMLMCGCSHRSAAEEVAGWSTDHHGGHPHGTADACPARAGNIQLLQ